ncbi:MAG: N-acetyltransferase family protein [Haloferacaceae archaeon]
MTQDRTFPSEPAGPFPTPPVTYTDQEGREIEIRRFDADQDFEPLVEMYDAFDPADRAQGIPPAREDRIREWLEDITADDCLNVVAWHGDTAAGHATLVPDDDASELAIFVLQEYQQAKNGTRIIETLLGYGREEGVEKVWLTVERWNSPAVNLYEKVGFETSNAESFELEMGLRLRAAD